MNTEDILRSCANTDCEKLFTYTRHNNFYCSVECKNYVSYGKVLKGKGYFRLPRLIPCTVCKTDFLKTRQGEKICSDACRKKRGLITRAKYLGRVSASIIPIRANPGKKKGPTKEGNKRRQVELICKNCGKIFLGDRYRSLYCERKCFKRAYFLRGKELLLPPPNACVDLPGEIWKEIPTLRGLFDVSNFGRVRQSFLYKRRSNGNQFYPGRIREPYKMPSGFDKIMIYVSSNKHQSTNMFVHILVASVFIANPLKLDWVIHKDGNRKNNCVDNLEWSNTKAIKKSKKQAKMPAYKRGSYSKRWRAIKEKESQQGKSLFSRIKKVFSGL